MKHDANWLGERILDLFFPPRCPYCGEVIRIGTRVCPRCADIEPTPIQRWIPMQDAEPAPCIAAYPYRPPIRDAMHRFKFEGEPELAKFYGKILADVVRQTEWQFDVLTWVPMSRWRQMRRGYNQSMLLAKVAAQFLRRPARPLLEKHRLNRRQHRLTVDARWKNVADVFDARPEADGHAILLIDDIVTTGATMQDCGRALLQAGAKSICCAAVATPQPVDR